MIDVIENLESELMPEFEAVAAHLSSFFPSVDISTESRFTGPSESPTYWGMGISCYFRNASPQQVDLVALSLDIAHLQTTPTINADICWGHPSGYIEMSFYEDWRDSSDWPEASPRKIEEVRAFLPSLFGKLERILNAGPKSITEEA